jgi:hypothetical protein
MKIKEGYLLRNVAGNDVVVPVGNLDFDGMITLNETGSFIWKALEKGCSMEELISKFLEEYDVDPATAEKDLAAFLQKLKEADLVTD